MFINTLVVHMMQSRYFSETNINITITLKYLQWLLCSLLLLLKHLLELLNLLKV